MDDARKQAILSCNDSKFTQDFNKADAVFDGVSVDEDLGKDYNPVTSSASQSLQQSGLS